MARSSPVRPSPAGAHTEHNAVPPLCTPAPLSCFAPLLLCAGCSRAESHKACSRENRRLQPISWKLIKNPRNVATHSLLLPHRHISAARVHQSCSRTMLLPPAHQACCLHNPLCSHNAEDTLPNNIPYTIKALDKRSFVLPDRITTDLSSLSKCIPWTVHSQHPSDSHGSA